MTRGEAEAGAWQQAGAHLHSNVQCERREKNKRAVGRGDTVRLQMSGIRRGEVLATGKATAEHGLSGARLQDAGNVENPKTGSGMQ